MASWWFLLKLVFKYIHQLTWLHLWSYVMLMIIFCLIIPDFGGASYIYNLIVKCWNKCFGVKDNSLRHAEPERCMKDNGTEAMEKLIASKNTMCRIDAKVTNEFIATANEQVLKINGEKLQTEHEVIKDFEAIEQTETPAATLNTTRRPDAEATNEIIDNDNKEMLKTIEDKVKQEEFTCRLCQVTTSCKKNMDSHYKGRRHNTNSALEAKKNQPITCQVCGVDLPNQESFTSHKQGYWHLSKIKPN